MKQDEHQANGQRHVMGLTLENLPKSDKGVKFNPNTFYEVTIETSRGNFDVVTNIPEHGNVNSLPALLDNWSARVTDEEAKDIPSLKRSLIVYVAEKEIKYGLGYFVFANMKVFKAMLEGGDAVNRLTEEDLYR